MKKNQIKLVVAFVMITLVVISCKKLSETDSIQAVDDKNQVAPEKLMGSMEFCGLNDLKTAAAVPITTKSVVIQNNIVFNTDFISAGVGGMRGVGNGDITFPAAFNVKTVTKAYLYWHGVTNSAVDAGDEIKVNGTTVKGTNIGVSSSNCWSFANSQAYRADVTTFVQAATSNIYKLTDFGAMDPNGASMILFYNDGNAGNNRDVVVFDGNDSNIAFAGIPTNPKAPADPRGWNVLLSGINYSSGQANIQLHVGDGQPFQDAALRVNATELEPQGPVFQGNTVPGGQLWDIKSYDVSSSLNPGSNDLNLTTDLLSDCLSLVVALIDLPAGAAPKISVDFRPMECPNLFYCTGKGLLPVSIAGRSDFDISRVDLSTIKLNGIEAKQVIINDVTTPYIKPLTDCKSCHKLGADGVKDISFKIDNQALFATLGKVVDNQCVRVTLTARLKAEFGGAFISGEDTMLINAR